MATNLPSPLTSFIGRQRELAELRRLLTTTRLLTLVGPGGSGKTRLAYELGASSLTEYPDGVWAVEFAPLSDPELVPQVTAAALSVPERPGWSLTDGLVHSLRDRTALLVFDNCEHLTAACAALAQTLLARCPAVRVLATSRERLGVAGELLFPVPSLSLPDAESLPPPENLMEYEAVRLFVDRAAFYRPGFGLTRHNSVALVDVCRRLDGMPLAIELAAARIRVLSADEIAARLFSRFRLLTGGSRTVAPRHQTLQAAMDWSYDLLSVQDRALLRRLSVFAGGWTLAAAEAVCAGQELGPADVLELLASLSDKSLVQVDHRTRDTRYRLLETIRQYGRERAAESGELAAAQRRHAEWYVRFAEQGQSELRGPGQEAWLDRLEAEHDNLRAALEWSAGHEEGAGAQMRLAGALRWFWFIRGYWTEGRRWLEAVLARSGGGPDVALTRVLQGAARLARFQGDYGRARTLCEEGLTLSRRLGDEESHIWFLISSGAVELHQGDWPHAAGLFEEGLTRARTLGDKGLTSTALLDLGVVARLQGDLERSEGLLTEGLALSRDANDKWRTALSLHSLGLLAFRREDYRRAAALYAESLALARQLRDRWIADDCLDGLAALACARGHYAEAARMLGAADELRETLGYRPLADVQADHDRCAATARVGLGADAFAGVWNEGKAMTLERVIADALAAAERLAARATSAAAATDETGAGVLTRREREVAALIAQGKTNREIAVILVIAERTADTHVQHILNKLGLSSRAQIAGWAVAHGVHTVTSP